MTPDDFRRLVSAGLATEQIALVMEMMERDAKSHADAEEARKSKGRDRVAKWRQERRNVTVTQQNVTELLTGGDARGEDKPLTQKIEPQESKKEEETRKRASSSPDFDAFWSVYPHKVGKPVAEAKFAAARRIADIETIMAGLQAYVAKTDDRPWCNPATWLHQQRWADQPATVMPQARASPAGPKPNSIQAAIERRRATQYGDDARATGISGAPVLQLSSFSKR